MRLIDKGLAQVVLTRNVDLAARLELKKLALDGGETFDGLRAVWRVWYERGRDKGLAFDLEVSIALARVSSERACDADQRGTAANDLGSARCAPSGSARAVPNGWRRRWRLTARRCRNGRASGCRSIGH